jgi:hypothetical protein
MIPEKVETGFSDKVMRQRGFDEDAGAAQLHWA